MKKTALKASSTKILASVVLVAGAASVAGLGTFGAFTSTTSASEAVGTGKVVLGLTQHASLGTTVAATNLVPGDTVQRAVVLTRSSDTEAFGSIKLTTTGATANKLTTDQIDGLKLTVDQCTTGWTKATGTNDLTCAGGTVTNLVAARPVVGTNLDLGAATTALNTNAAAANLRLTLTLPEAADNTFQGLSNTVAFTFDATQRAAQAK
ncbi:hypothetical protein [Nocardioides lijunqiniae]|uniref:hypothetical protein n=1 Tax=Nocardioides lijunqiniae TaxID=2760832 RepID=UPI0018788B38|nr:hypothetical protein [Nocardioides lijunqiniae]